MKAEKAVTQYIKRCISNILKKYPNVTPFDLLKEKSY